MKKKKIESLRKRKKNNKNKNKERIKVFFNIPNFDFKRSVNKNLFDTFVDLIKYICSHSLK